MKISDPVKVELLIICESESEYLAIACGVGGGGPAEPLSPASATSPVRLRNSARLSSEVRRLSRVAAKRLPWKLTSRSPVTASSAN